MTSKSMAIREAFAERERGRKWWSSLSNETRWALGDALVLDFDWRDWFERRPSRAFLNGVDLARIDWEIMS